MRLGPESLSVVAAAISASAAFSGESKLNERFARLHATASAALGGALREAPALEAQTQTARRQIQLRDAAAPA